MGMLSNIITPEMLSSLIPPEMAEMFETIGNGTIEHYKLQKEMNLKLTQIIDLLNAHSIIEIEMEEK